MTFLKAMKSLDEGEKVRCKLWGRNANYYLYLSNNRIESSVVSGQFFGFTAQEVNGDWEIYKNQKIKRNNENEFIEV